MPAARFSTGLSKIKKGLFSTGLAKIKAGYMYESGEYTKVWSFGSKVSYYDGDTLIGIKEVDGGDDVLRPDFDMSKTGYTHVGWAETPNGEIVTELTATGEPMTLYAVYVIDTITVVTGSITGGVYPDYTCTSQNTDYVTGDVGGEVSRWYTIGTNYASWTFALDKKHYQTATATFGNAMQGAGTHTIDGSNFNNGTIKTLDSGNHNISASVTNDYTETWAINASGITSLVLSNPKAWE